MSKIKLCQSCLDQLKAASSRGGRAGSHADKLRASKLAGKAREAQATVLTFNGKSLRVKEWAKETGIPKVTIWRRMRANLPIEKILAVHGAQYLPVI